MELVLPQNYVEIEQEEMMYLDGGFGIPNWIVSNAINIGLAALTGGGGIKLLISYIRRNGSSEAKKKFRDILSRFVANQVANRAVGLLFGALHGFLSFSVGSAITTIWDRNDIQPSNGYLNALW